MYPRPPAFAALDPELIRLYAELPPELETDYCKGITLAPFGPGTFEEIEATWVNHPGRRCRWDWLDCFQQFRRSPNRIEMVVRVDKVLVAAFLGKKVLNSGEGRPRIEMHYIESAPAGGHPLVGSIAPLVSDVCATYGTVVGAEELRVCHPVEPLHGYYESLGFGFPSANRLYCWKPIEVPL